MSSLKYFICATFLIFSSATAQAQGNDLSSSATKKPSETSLPDHEVILTRGGVSVTMGDLRARALEIPESDRVLFFSSRQRVDETLRQLLEMKQLADAARSTGLEMSYE